MSKRSKAELLGLVEKIISLYETDKKTIKQIEVILNEEGYDISRESIRRSIKTSKQIANELKKTRNETIELVKAFEGMPAAETGEVMVDFLTAKIFDSVKTIDELKFQEPQKLIQAVANLNNSKVNIAKLRLSFEEGAKRTKEKILDELNVQLQSDPELLERLRNVIVKIEVKGK